MEARLNSLTLETRRGSGDGGTARKNPEVGNSLQRYLQRAAGGDSKRIIGACSIINCVRNALGNGTGKNSASEVWEHNYVISGSA